MEARNSIVLPGCCGLAVWQVTSVAEAADISMPWLDLEEASVETREGRWRRNSGLPA